MTGILPGIAYLQEDDTTGVFCYPVAEDIEIPACHLCSKVIAHTSIHYTDTRPGGQAYYRQNDGKGGIHTQCRGDAKVIGVLLGKKGGIIYGIYRWRRISKAVFRACKI